jgi:hypothetical protein
VTSVDKVVLFAFNGDPMCFIHVLLNALDFNARGFEVKLVVEGSATRLVGEIDDPDHDLHILLVGICKACAAKMGTLEAARAQGLHLLDEMSGHPSMASFMDQGYKVITF